VRLDLLAQQPMRHRVVVAVDIDMVVESPVKNVLSAPGELR
jgi:hypothetical protein